MTLTDDTWTSRHSVLATLVSVTLIVMPTIVARADTTGNRDIPSSTPGSYGSDANGATSGNTMSSTTGEDPVESRDKLSGDTP